MIRLAIKLRGANKMTAYFWDQESKTLTQEGDDKVMSAFIWTNLHELNQERMICFGCGVTVWLQSGRLWNIKNEHYDRRIALCQDCHGLMVGKDDELAMEADYRDQHDTLEDARPTL